MADAVPVPVMDVDDFLAEIRVRRVSRAAKTEGLRLHGHIRDDGSRSDARYFRAFENLAVVLARPGSERFRELLEFLRTHPSTSEAVFETALDLAQVMSKNVAEGPAGAEDNRQISALIRALRDNPQQVFEVYTKKRRKRPAAP